MPKAVRFNHYGNVDVLEVTEVERLSPSPGRGRRATGPGGRRVRSQRRESKPLWLTLQATCLRLRGNTSKTART
jgi:hypothetical protein